MRIGVLGGIGPEATKEFYSKLIGELQERGLVDSNVDFPSIFINSIPAPELVDESISREDLAPYFEGIRELEMFSPDFIVMVCNTIHLFHEVLQEFLDVPLLNLKELIGEELRKNGYDSVLVIGTPSTVNSGLYDFRGVKVKRPSRDELESLSQAILFFNRGQEKKKQEERVSSICHRYLEEDVDAVVLGCTELAVMLDWVDFPTINTVDVLVEAVLRRFIANS